MDRGQHRSKPEATPLNQRFASLCPLSLSVRKGSKALAAADPPAAPRESKMPVKVFGSPTSAEVARVLACLFEKDVEFQLIRVDSFRGTKRLPQYLKLQPHGEALTFEDGNVTLVESRKILRHIADKYKNQGYRDLFGPGALERASIEQWLQTEAQSFDVPSADMVYSLAYLPPDMQLDGRGVGGLPAATGTMNPAHRQKVEEMLQLFEKSRRQLGKLLDIYEQRLGEEAFLAGGKFTLADLSHLPNADRLAGDPRSARLMESRRNVSKWWDTVSRRDSWVRVKELQRPPSAEAPF
ncbi:glutathione transferase14 [Zea mays]|uniref:glutathione transferase n=2 Tax=Zea mays TaxID=4577 RepID=A0A1D6K7U3_MAIZE|nr:glutathione transferase14 [Zea mays]